MKIRLGTRASDLATAQSRRIERRLRANSIDVETILIKTEGDMDQARPFVELGPAGLFVRALELALVENRVDLAVHSYKDLPSLSPEELIVAAMPERMDARDRLLISSQAYDSNAEGLLPLGHGARVGTASARRISLLKELRPDLNVDLLRGNVPTRLNKLRQGKFDAILLAAAGLQRLDEAVELGEIPTVDRSSMIELDLDPHVFVPAPSQGALALQVRRNDANALQAMKALDAELDHRCVRVERQLLALIEAGCQVPFGAYCRATGRADELELVAYLERGGECRRVTMTGGDGEALAQQAYRGLIKDEGGEA